MHRSLPRVQHYWSRADQRVLAWSAGCGSRDRAWPGGCVDRRRSAGRWVPSPSHALGVARCRRAVRVRSGITATVAARTAALTAMRVICRPGMPPTITAWVLVAGGAGGPCRLPGGGRRLVANAGPRCANPGPCRTARGCRPARARYRRLRPPLVPATGRRRWPLADPPGTRQHATLRRAEPGDRPPSAEDLWQPAADRECRVAVGDQGGDQDLAMYLAEL